MADADQSLYNLRYNQVEQGLEGFGGGTPQWTPLILNADGGVTGIKISAGATNTGLVTLAAGTNITIANSPAGTFTINAAGGGGTPGGSNTNVQFNSSGAFGGDGQFTWDDIDAILSINSYQGGSFLGYQVVDTTNLKNWRIGVADSSGDFGIFETQVGIASIQVLVTGQTAIGSQVAPDPSATLTVEPTLDGSTYTGFLPPAMSTTNKNSIATPAEGLVVYDLTLHALCVYNGTAWKTVTAA